MYILEFTVERVCCAKLFLYHDHRKLLLSDQFLSRQLLREKQPKSVAMSYLLVKQPEKSRQYAKIAIDLAVKRRLDTYPQRRS